MPVTAIIPARGNSKCLPRKNLRLVHGRPLIVRAIRASKPVVDRVIVSTEDDEIADVARAAGAEVRMRPAALAADDASSESVLVDACKACGVHEGVLVFQQCTSPLTRPSTVQLCVDEVAANEMAVAVTATDFHAPVWQPLARSWIGLNHDENAKRSRRQDMPPQVRETGAVYAFDVQRFLRAKHRFCGPVHMVMVPSWEAVDVDDETDIEIADVLARRHDPLPDLSRFRLVVFDFDGVIGDGHVWTDSAGRESVRCSKEDSAGFIALRKAGIEMAVLTHEVDQSVVHRCFKLGLPCHMTQTNKAAMLPDVVKDLDCTLSETVYVGNDSADVGCFGLVGLSVCPADAHPSARVMADLVLWHDGGNGAVRELADLLVGGR